MKHVLANGFLAALGLTTLSGTMIAETHCRRTRSRCCVRAYDYEHDTRRAGGSVIAIADAARKVTWLQRDARAFDGVKRSVVVERQVRRKPFHFPATSLTVDHISLDRVGLAIYDNGEIAATGRVTHNGGADGGLSGNNVTVHLRAYAGRAGSRAPLADAPVVWETTCKFWVSRDDPRVVSLVPWSCSSQAIMSQFFNEITHLEVELEYQRDR